MTGLVALMVSAWGCRRDATPEDEGPQIETEKMVEKNPDVPRPSVVFPQRWHSTDDTVNAFVEQALRVCAEGDYDGFRQLFGTTYPPPDQTAFERVWHAVGRIAVAGFYRGSQDVPTYYLHAAVEYRQADRKGRTRRDAVLVIFREVDEWRLAPAPAEVQRKVIAASTRPAEPEAGPSNGPASASPAEASAGSLKADD